MVKKILIIRRDNVVFTESVEDENPDLFHSLEDSLNSFKDDQKLFEIKGCLFNSDIDNSFVYENVSNDLESDKQTDISRKTQTDQSITDQHKAMTCTETINQRIKENYIRTLERNNNVLEQLLDELESLKKERLKTGKLNNATKQITSIKQKLAHFLYQNEQNQLNSCQMASTGKLFLSNEECIRFVTCIVERNLNLRIDSDDTLNLDLNLYLRLHLMNELLLIRILRNLNIAHDSRATVERYLNYFKLKIRPELMKDLIDLQMKFRALDRAFKYSQIAYTGLFERYLQIQEEKEVLKLNFVNNSSNLIEYFRMEIKQLHIGNLNFTNKLNIMDRTLKRIQNKI